jgi:trehalose synthase-fused probable maltokinase
MTTTSDLSFLDEERLGEWVMSQRWFGSKSRSVSALHLMHALEVCAGPPKLVIALVEVRFQAGTHVVYQLPIGLRPVAEGWDRGVITETADWTVYDALGDEELGQQLFKLIRDGHDVQEEEGAVAEFRSAEAVRGIGELPVRPVGVEQSNSSLIFGDRLVLKAYRRVEPGPNPELELLRFLTRHGFEHVARLQGWYAYVGHPMEATLGVLQEYIPGGRDGWELALDEVGTDPQRFVARLAGLGAVIGEMHAVLGSDMSDPAFAPEEPSAENLSLLTATIDEEIEQIFLDLPDGDERLAPIAGRGEEVRERLRMLAQVAVGGRVIRHHGDLHLGQALLRGEEDWVILDFEGEPARSLVERRRKRSPLRDVAGMLRSFAYVASGAEKLRGNPAPPEWERRAREAFLMGYFETVDSTLLPPGEDATRRLLSVFELEKAVYELRYELNNRPEWLEIPVTGIARLLADDAA